MNTKIAYSDLAYLNPQRHYGAVVYTVVCVTLFVSLLPNILWKEVTHTSSEWLFWVKLAVLGLVMLVSVALNVLPLLRSYLVILAVLLVAEGVSGLIGATSQWKNLFSDASFSSHMLSVQLLRLLVTLIMIVTLFVIKGQRARFFLVAGQTHAPVEPVPWLGVNRGLLWSRFGWIAATCISLGTLIFLLAAGLPDSETFLNVLPAVLLFALMNSFSEEMNYRAAFLATLDGVLSQQHAIILTALYFGIGHFYGVPYGMIGVVMAGALGWLLGKAMLETRGLFWPWLIHLVQDVLIFSFIAMGSVVPGGK